MEYGDFLGFFCVGEESGSRWMCGASERATVLKRTGGRKPPMNILTVDIG